MNKITYFSIIIGTALTFQACKSAQKATTTSVKTETATANPLSISTILSKIEGNEIKADWLAGDVDADYKGKPMSISASMNARFRRDSVIWLNVKKLGFNVARAKMTPDSIFIVNYIQSNYIAQDLKYIEQKYGIPADFKTLQNILLGNAVFLTDKNALKVEKDASGDIILRGSNAQWKNMYRLDSQADMIKEMVFEQPATERYLKITYENYAILRGYANDQKKFPYIRTLNMESPQTGKISITLEVDADGLEVNVPKNIKFEIPSHYDRAN